MYSLPLLYLVLISMAFIFRSYPSVLGGVAVFAVAGLFPVWALFNTRYILTGETLTLICGPKRKSIPTAEIEAIAPVHGRLDGMSLSTSGLLLTFSNSKTLFISPLEPARFVAELSRVAPQIQIID